MAYEVVGRVGEPARGITPGTVFGSFDGPGAPMSWAGNGFAFRNFVNDNGVERCGVWFGERGIGIYIAPTGLDAPGLRLPLASVTGNPVLSQVGMVAFRGVLDTNHPEVTSDNDEVLFYGPIQEVRPLLREGDPVPGMPGRTVGSFALTLPLEIAPDGRLAFDMGTAPSASGSVWIAYPDREVVLLCGEGSTIEIEGQDWLLVQGGLAGNGDSLPVVDPGIMTGELSVLYRAETSAN